MMTRPAGVLVAVGLLALTGCGDDDESGRLDPDLSVSSASTTVLPPKEDAEQQAVTMLTLYLSARDTAWQDPETYSGAPGLEATSETSALTDVRSGLSDLLDAGEKQQGETVVVGTPAATKTDLEADGGSGQGSTSTAAPQPAETSTAGQATTPPSVQPPSVQLEACLDATGVTRVKLDGSPAAKASPGERKIWRASVVNRRYPNSASWRVAWLEETTQGC